MARTSRFLLAVAFILGLVAWPKDSHSRGRVSPQDSNWSELMGSMERMHAAMASIEPSGNRDADFVKLMLPHHQGATDMAKAELLYGDDPQIRRLAQEIITDQESEVQLMRLWLKRHQARSHAPSQTSGARTETEP
jgi:uncharacterized protein (DUF305 family)